MNCKKIEADLCGFDFFTNFGFIYCDDSSYGLYAPVTESRAMTVEMNRRPTAVGIGISRSNSGDCRQKTTTNHAAGMDANTGTPSENAA